MQKKTLPPAIDIDVFIQDLVHHEWGNLVSVLTKVFGTHNLQLAEDVVQDTFLKAIQSWTADTLPEAPVAWLFTVARNKATDVLRKQKRDELRNEDLSSLLHSEYTLSPTLYKLISSDAIEDDKLRMIFVCCHPSLSSEASSTLILKAICGLTIAEIAKAFLAHPDTVEKRLYRAKQVFRNNNISFALPPQNELVHRLQRVLLCIYLLFNEAYTSTQHEQLVRTDLMGEAMQLCHLIISSPSVPHDEAHALMALMCFTASRNEARQDEGGNLLLMKNQNRKKWNRELILKGIHHLEQSVTDQRITRYHLEAGIAYEHAKAKDYKHTDWKQIVQCYDLLFHLQRSPLVALNRAIAVSELHGAVAGLEAIQNIEGIAFLKHYYLLPATLAKLYVELHEYEKAVLFFEQAAALTKSVAEKTFLQKRIRDVKSLLCQLSSL